MVEPPAQLRLRTDLDGLTVRVSGKQRSSFELFKKREVRLFGWMMVGALWLAGYFGPSLFFLPAFALMGLLYLSSQIDPAPGAWETKIRIEPGRMVLTRDGESRAVPWDQVGLVTVRETVDPQVEIRMPDDRVYVVPMELEPPEHAVWLAMTVDERAMEAREKRGSVADIPRSIRRIRN